MKRYYSLDFVVGLFVLAGVFAFLLLALKVSGLEDFSWTDDSYVVKANFSNIGGLKPRSRVTIGGVNVGRVKQITLDAGNDSSGSNNGSYDAVVEISFNKNLVTKLPDDSIASIRTAGLIGDNYIAITPGGSETFLKSGDVMSETHSALVLEDLISKYLFSKTEDTETDKKDKKEEK